MTTKNLFNSTGLEAVLEVLHRRLGAKLNADFLTASLDTEGTALTLTSKARGSDGSFSPYRGNVSYTLQKLPLDSQLGVVLSWGQNFPAPVSVLMRYLEGTYGLYLDDGEVCLANDPSKTPLVRGQVMPNTPDASGTTFTLEALAASLRFTKGSQLVLALAAPATARGKPIRL